MYKVFDSFLFRTPYFPYSALKDFKKDLRDPIFREMLHVASPDLIMAIKKNADKEKLRNSAYLYYQRACTRPTPFGLFAGCSMGIIGEHTEIQLSEQKKYKRNTRLDMDYICALTQQIEKNRNIRELLFYYPNSSIYPVANHFRYVEYYYKNTRREHHITQVENSEYLQAVLTLARSGARFCDLVNILIYDEITREEAAEFIHKLIDNQVLTSELEPSVTNMYPLTALIEKLKKLSKMNNQITNILSEIEMQLKNIDQQAIGTTCNIYPAIIKNIEKTKIEANIKYLFQTDMFKPVQNASVSRYLIKDIQQGLAFLNKITAPVARTNLSLFRENYIKRYENREMPLLFVLDNELGIGYGNKTTGDTSSLIDDLLIPQRNPSSNVHQFPIQSVLLSKYQQSPQKIIELTDDDVKSVEAIWNDLPDSISVMCQILQDNNDGRCVFIKGAGGQSATNLLGRFCHIDEEVLNHTLSIVEKEVQLHPNTIIAEIVHLPESRTGNGCSIYLMLISEFCYFIPELSPFTVCFIKTSQYQYIFSSV
ncbi:MAG: lantibiotic dehydratase family protein, partial [Bacteroidales bacterium]|nr:lantibiotic dehydratase family protein [Bacteroidales bacterium]